MRAVPLRRRLLLLAAVAILPLALMSGIALQALLEHQRRQAEQSSLDLVRALATAVDTELRLTVSALESLALTEPIGSASAIDLASAHRFARRVLAVRPEWREILLAARDGTPLFSTTYEFGAPLPSVAEPKSLAEVVRILAIREFDKGLSTEYSQTFDCRVRFEAGKAPGVIGMQFNWNKNDLKKASQ